METDKTMLYLYTDFGVLGPYVGQMKSVIYEIAPTTLVVDLMHDAPKFNPRASSYLFSALTEYLPRDSIVVAVIDPEVGKSSRRPVMVHADTRWYIGPDNGLFQHVMRKARDVNCYQIIPDEVISRTFHGRDVFAPAAAQLINQKMPESKEISKNALSGADWPDELAEIIYIDDYGNAMTGIRACSIEKTSLVKVGQETLSYADTFSSVSKDQLFWYENSIGLVEISQNLGNAEKQLSLNIGSQVFVIKEESGQSQ